MAFSGNFMCTSFKKELLEAKHNFLKIQAEALFSLLYTRNSAIFYLRLPLLTLQVMRLATLLVVHIRPKGNTLTRVDPSTSGTTALTDFADSSWSSASFTARGALIFNDSASGDPTVVVLDFGADKTASNGTFTVVFPTG